jgi:hypothetical protein
LDESLQCFEKTIARKKFQEGGRFAARDNEAVDIRQFFWLLYENRLRACFV